MERSNLMRRAVLIFALVVLVGVIVFNAIDYRKTAALPSDFLSCATAGNPVVESFPRRCRSADGRTFVEDIDTTVRKDSLIQVELPRPNASVESPLTVLGSARGSWFFEASFPVVIESATGTVISQGIATALAPWMTEDFVPFRATLSFTTATAGPAVLVLKKDNPSGLPEKDDELRIPIQLLRPLPGQKVSSRTASSTTKACMVTGCSSQVCADEEVMTTCEFKSSYMCFEKARCERQANGTCGWTDTPELRACQADADAIRKPVLEAQ